MEKYCKEKFEEVKELLFKYSPLGIEEHNKGAILIGKAPHYGSEAWLNKLYPPISDEYIIKIEEEMNMNIPESYVEFLTNCSNGLNVLHDKLCLFGYRFNYIRTIEESSWQPYNIDEVNVYEKPGNSTEDMFFIGWYDWDGSLLYMTPDQRIHFCAEKDARSLKSWDSLFSMLISEIKRLYTLFDSRGIKIDKSQPTIPVY